MSQTSTGFWQRLDPARKRQIVVGVLILGIIALLYPIAKAPESGQARPAEVRRENLQNVITDANPRELGISALNRELRQMSESNADLQRRLQQVEQRPSEPGTAQVPLEVADLQDKIATLERLMQAQAEAPTLPPPPQPRQAPAGTTYQTQGTGTPAGVAPGARGPQTTALRIRAIDQSGAAAAGAPQATPAVATGGEGRAAGPQRAVSQTDRRDEVIRRSLRLPSGSILTGVLINGVDAPTGRGAVRDPLPVLVRVKHEALLPSRHRADVRECHIIAAAYGVLSTERAMMRSERISCILEDGRAIETPIEMYAVGEDGRAGVRGRLVSRQGQIIAKATLAGIAEGISSAFQPNFFGGGIGGGNTTFNGDEAMRRGSAAGAGSALGRIADYHLSLADEMFPHVEIDIGREVSFFTVRGTDLKPEGT